ncbi:uncharacterized protein LOC133532387 [Cydia pomonella]|uniref:uncharacterized protein LOC133532387 n=1 Tax=Cydia pomonella TaxID=82600 RepID=UPI002ADE775C|nr:uncharacterized protein LOC133532387 [Cydia pomonella]XP_061726994.1 uncharacterized protein LOC133532387 [Cydia pomonella]XP_061727004.1 uncharacterized protein LOC133532387 [Cydia pomonella]
MDRRKPKSRSPAARSPSPYRKTDPTPIELDRYIPWMFMKLQSEQTVVIKRVQQEEYPRARNSRFLSSSRVSRVSTVSVRQTESNPTLVTTVPTNTSLIDVENTIQLTIVYSRAGHAVEIAINACPFPINRELTDVISLSLPYHTRLNKFTCKGKGSDTSVIIEIVKMMQFSNLTDVCLDNTFVTQGTYYILLDQASTLRCLSLSKCTINDIVCKKIAERLDCNGPASKNLRILNLSCNLITDIGAHALGHSLRTNRHIMHLNLCGNTITSVGAGYLLEPLSEFPFTADEIKERIRRRRDFYNKKAAIPKSPTSTYTNLSIENGKNLKDREFPQKKSSFNSKTVVNLTGFDERVVVEDFSDPSNTVYKNGRSFSIGNLTLCSLNLGYNYLDYTILSKIIDVLLYQKDQERTPRRTGLLRIVIEGNNLSVSCEEYSKIEMCLAILNNEAWSFKKKRKSSSKARREINSRNASSVVLVP